MFLKLQSSCKIAKTFDSSGLIKILPTYKNISPPPKAINNCFAKTKFYGSIRAWIRFYTNYKSVYDAKLYNTIQNHKIKKCHYSSPQRKVVMPGMATLVCE